MEKSVRNSGHELLRIVAMYMIVFIHANMYLGNFCTGTPGSFFNGVVNGICNIGVTCFILISGFYGIKFNLMKLVKMECMMITYSILETIILVIISPEQMQGAMLLEQLVKSFLPLISRKYWFYSCYVCLFLLSGYIQKFIDHLNREEFRRVLLLLLMLFSVFPTLFYFELIPDNGKGLVQMIMIYMVGRYIRLYHNEPIRESCVKQKSAVLFILLWAINGLSHEFPIQIGGIYHHLCKDNSITNIAMAIILFIFFREVKFQSRLVNKAASYIFAVFALNNSFVNVVMVLFEKCGFQSPDGVMGFLLLAGTVVLILALCLLTGVFREAILGKADQKIGEIINDGILERLKGIEE